MEIKKEHKDLKIFKQIPLIGLENYLINEFGIIYNTYTNKYLYPEKKENIYIKKIKKIQYQIKNLLYQTFINKDIDTNVKSKYCVTIKKDAKSGPYLNFRLEDLEYKLKSDILKDQERNNRKINIYDKNKKFIKSFEDKNEIKEYLNIKDLKYVNKCLNKDDKMGKYKDMIYKYDDEDDIKNPELLIEQIKLNENIIDYSTEIWKQLNESEFHAKYEISNFGRFRNIKTKKILSQQLNKQGYYIVSINMYNKNNKMSPKKERTNVLVAKYFIEIPENLKNKNNLVVDHINNNQRYNNHFTNLQWTTRSINRLKDNKN